jgi:hypothetical protein
MRRCGDGRGLVLENLQVRAREGLHLHAKLVKVVLDLYDRRRLVVYAMDHNSHQMDHNSH